MKRVIFILLTFLSQLVFGASILIPMDAAQTNHLKAYGFAYFALQKNISVDWLLNYRGGSFMVEWSSALESECKVRGIYTELITAKETNAILKQVNSPAVNMNVVRMDKAPRIAVYSPKNELIDDESDAVITVLDYAEIPYTIIYGGHCEQTWLCESIGNEVRCGKKDNRILFRRRLLVCHVFRSRNI